MTTTNRISLISVRNRCCFRTHLAISLYAFFAVSLCAKIANGAEHGLSVNPDKALKMLLDGNDRFVRGRSIHPHQEPSDRTRLADSQHPFAIILGCSDSRTSPDVIFDQGLGDLFVVRVAGNVSDPIIVESISYAAEHLGARLVLVLGHDRCGAVSAAVHSKGESKEYPELVSAIRPAVEATADKGGDPVDNAINENVRITVEQLQQADRLGALVESGQLKIVGARYKLDSGKVTLVGE